ncbi:DUF4192 domain-containing protein [Nocardioides sp. cx-169]|uniref:DUF4192 domain-containing protein n=1 Tax=Nocardioides sp. cx-169 TaxID=2899080 RepID=UPI001E28977B|nr:DUF4192 domain-containing protein [Nocardioides sp. cx-169]MCD4534849.1 DUF4192 domain-containing protein [Nocardioides sp. cx-169]
MTPTEPMTMVARCPEDVLAMVCVTLGFDPDESVAMLTFGGPRAFQARVDLPRCRAELPETVESLLGPATAHRVRQVVFVVYTDDEVLARQVWRGLRERCRQAAISVVEALRADGRRWYPLLRGDRLIREIGVAYDVTAHPFLVDAVLRGRVTHASRDALDATLDPHPGRVAAVEAALPAGGPPTGPAALLAEGDWVRSTVRGHVVEDSRPGDHAAARLLSALRTPRLRDAAWDLVAGDAAAAHVELWSDLVRRCPRELLAAPAFLLGWSAWRAGHGALAWCALDRVADADPGYPPAAELALLLTHAVPPDAWEPDLDWADGLRPPRGRPA